MPFRRQEHRLRTLGVLAATLSLLVASACGSDAESTGEDEPLQVTFVSGLTGFLSLPANAVLRGMQAHVDSLNDEGGLNGRKIELTSLDNQSDPTRGATVVQEHIGDKGKPDLILPGATSNEVMAIAPILGRNEIVGISQPTTAMLDDTEKFPYVFSTSATSDTIMALGLEYILSQGDVKRIALVTPDDSLGEAQENAFKQALEGKGVEIMVERFKADGVDYTPSFQKAKDFDPDWIVTDAQGTQVPNLLTSRVKAAAEDIPMLAGVAFSNQPLFDLAKKSELKNVVTTNPKTSAYLAPEDRDDEFNDFFERVQEQGPIEGALSQYAYGWAVIDTWADAIRSLGDAEITGKAIKEALETLEFQPGAVWPMWSGNYSADSHFKPGSVDDLTFGTPVEQKDDMIVVK